MITALRNPSQRTVSAVKIFLFLLALVPLGRLVVGAFFFPEWLGANPAEFITRATGDWTLRFLLITLAVTPLRRLSGWNWLLRLRRMLGLFAFFYGTMHFTSYLSFDMVFNLNDIIKDIIKRPFITVGFASLLLMLPLAVTSANYMVRKLGGKRWTALHRLAYVIAPMGVLHFWWMVKRDVTEPAIYAVVLLLLLGLRIFWKIRSNRAATVAGRA